MKFIEFSRRINQVLDQAGYPPKNRGRIQLLSELMGLSHRGVGKWINGESRPPLKTCTVLAEKLKVNVHWLRTGEGPMEISPSPVLTTISSLPIVPIFYTRDLLTPHRMPYQHLPCLLSPNKDYFGILLESESMSPRFPVKSIIIFEPTAVVGDGDFVLLSYPPFPEPIFRQILISGSTRHLVAHNPKFDTLSLEPEHQILGKLTQAIVLF